jgi:hypothetical protein
MANIKKETKKDDTTTYDIDVSQGLETLLEQEQQKFNNVVVKPIELTEEQKEREKQTRLELLEKGEVAGLKIIKGKNSYSNHNVIIRDENNNIVKTVSRENAPRKQGAIRLTDLMKK